SRARTKPRHSVGLMFQLFFHRAEGVQRNPDLKAWPMKHETRSHDSDDRVALEIEENLAANEAGVAVEMMLPEAIADDHDRRGILAKIVGLEQTAVEGRHAQD